MASLDSFGLEEQVVVVTGAGRGIGRVIASEVRPAGTFPGQRAMLSLRRPWDRAKSANWSARLPVGSGLSVRSGWLEGTANFFSVARPRVVAEEDAETAGSVRHAFFLLEGITLPEEGIVAQGAGLR